MVIVVQEIEAGTKFRWDLDDNDFKFGYDIDFERMLQNWEE